MAPSIGDRSTLAERGRNPDSAGMVRVVVVNAERRVAERQAGALRAAGYEVELCGGPREEPCPVLDNLPCPLVDRADVLVYDAWVAGSSDGGRRLIAEMRETYADLPVVLTSADATLDWVERDGPHRVTPLAGESTGEALRAAVEAALADQGMAV
jgi:DNA-binding NtrC family response regulator